ncbi:DUF7739 domain-containing protein [Streptomyces sp. NPDC004082]
MGISIDGLRGSRSALTISNLGQHLAHALTGSEWREISFLFDGSFADVAHIPAGQAGRIADLLKKAASKRAMNTEWGILAAEIADAANQAARTGRDWTWS